MLDDGVWNSDDRAKLDAVHDKIANLLNMIALAQRAGGCDTTELTCSYDFALSRANPWVAGPYTTVTPTTWGAIVGWVGGQNVPILPDYSEATIQADFIPMTIESLTINYNFASTNTFGEDWAIRFFDHNLNLLLEVPDTHGTTVTWSGPPLDHVSRIQIHRRKDYGFTVDTIAILQVYMNANGCATCCTQLIPLADPPSVCRIADFKTGTHGWLPYTGAGFPGVWVSGTGWIPAAGNVRADIYYDNIVPFAGRRFALGYSDSGAISGGSGAALYNNGSVPVMASDVPIVTGSRYIESADAAWSASLLVIEIGNPGNPNLAIETFKASGLTDPSFLSLMPRC
jgi:hypothetical protein